MRWLWLIVCVALLIGGLVLWKQRAPSEPDASSGAPAEQGQMASKNPAEEMRSKPASIDGGEAPFSKKRAANELERRRAELFRRMNQARAAAPAAPKETRPQVTPTAIKNKTGSSEAWELRQIETLQELIGECHSLASEEIGEELTGALGITFQIRAEEEIGGLVDQIELMSEYTTIAEPAMLECVRESLYALEMDPPPEGIDVGRQLTLRFD